MSVVAAYSLHKPCCRECLLFSTVVFCSILTANANDILTFRDGANGGDRRSGSFPQSQVPFQVRFDLWNRQP